MICCVSLNPALDKYLRLDALRRGEHLEVREVIASAGGKALNVAGVLRALGEEVELIGFFGGPTGSYLLEELAREGVTTHAVPIRALTRTAFVLVEGDGTETEVVEPGGQVAEQEILSLRTQLRAAAARAAVVVLSGSVPPGCPDDIYVQLLSDCQTANQACPVLVDTSRAPLRVLLERARGARSIKPNRREAEAALGFILDGEGGMERGLRQFAAAGVTEPVISDGAEGLYALMEGVAWRAQSPRLERVNSVGSGDAAVAGLAAGLARGLPAAERLRLAAACGAANVLTKECAGVRPADLERLLPAMVCQPLR